MNANLREPVGDWVESEMLATRGMYVTGTAFSPLPFWSSVDSTFVLRDITTDPKPPKGKEPRKGVLLEPIRPKALLAVEVEMGKISERIPPNPGQATNRLPRTDDEAAAEVLFMYPDGTMELRSSARDMADPDREARDKRFKKWIKDTKDKVPVDTAQPKKDDF